MAIVLFMVLTPGACWAARFYISLGIHGTLASTQYILLVNSDAMLYPDSLREIVDGMWRDSTDGTARSFYGILLVHSCLAGYSTNHLDSPRSQS